MFKPRQDAIERDRAARRKHNLPYANLEFSKKRDIRNERPKMLDCINDAKAKYLLETGREAPNSVIRKWKEGYRRMYGVKDCTKHSHNVTSMPHLRRIENPKTPQKSYTKNKSAGGINPAKHRAYLDHMYNPEGFKEVYRKALARKQIQIEVDHE